MIVKKCDICGAEMRMTTPRYKVVFDGWLYKSEQDICVSCFERIKAEIQTADTPQTEKPKIRKRIDKPFRAVWLDDDHNEIGTPQTERSE